MKDIDRQKAEISQAKADFKTKHHNSFLESSDYDIFLKALSNKESTLTQDIIEMQKLQAALQQAKIQN